MGQVEFSADVVNLKEPGLPAETRLHVGATKVRIEPQLPVTQGHVPADVAPFIVADRHGANATAVMPQQREYLEAPPQMMQHYRQFFQTLDPQRGCEALLGAAENSDWSCHRVGDVDLDKRNTIEYEAKKPDGDVFRFWIDLKLRVPVRSETDNGGYELRNIQEGVQPANLFDVPSDYTKAKGTFGVVQSSKPVK
jgi:hypothetical protein